MSPDKKHAAAQRGARSKGLSQTSILTFLSTSITVKSSNQPLPVQTIQPMKHPEKSKNVKTHKNNRLTQQPITYYLTPNTSSSINTPRRPQKHHIARPTSPFTQLNMETEIFQHAFLSPTTTTQEELSPIWKQSNITEFFRPIRKINSQPINTVTTDVSVQPKSSMIQHKRVSLPRAVRRELLRYTQKCTKTKNTIHRYTISMPSYDLFDMWGHSLETIEVNSTFRVFLQNPNGLSVYQNNHLLRQDLQLCHDYGASVLCFPETNTNWNQEGQLTTMQYLFRGIWRSSTLQSSHTPDSFLSTYQPGGTLTAVCENWVSRVIGKGEDPFGLGRWSYVTMRGTGSMKLTIVTAYNACVSSGDTTYYHQQLRVLSRLFIAPNRSLHRLTHVGSLY